ncbi:WD40-repeat-containing domain protein [Catenaria anguillulae PL171]|uniref:WD40-repeat-containing domain protein n=1 Tax=Catenaria anguillulae PL171 TaxID=765915 RepID=A0A1Y2HWL5_9FUNG|nr:WD40-repeat-containing domain protein [Catenaria anguillulae PL171]
MDFSDVFKQSNNLCRFSPDGAHVANVVGHKLVVRDAETLHIVTVLTAVDAISAIEFSPDGKYLLCASYELGAIQVWEIDGTDPVAKIDEGITGCTRVMWDPYSARSILSWSAYGLRITVWNLLDGSIVGIQQPKYADRGYSWRKDNRYLAVLDRVDCKDFVCIYDAAGWEMVKRFAIDTNDADNLAWSPDGRHLVVWDSLLDFKVLIYSPEGNLMHTYAPYQYGLGVRNAVWSPTSQFVAVGGYDQKCHLLNHYTFNAIAEWAHVSSLTLTPKSKTVVFREPGCLVPAPTTAETSAPQWPLAASLTRPRVDADKSAKKVGVSMIRWSGDGRYVALKNENTPTLVYIYSIKLLRLLTIIQLADPIKSMDWMHHETKRHRLIVCTGSPCLYYWDGGYTIRDFDRPDQVALFNDEDDEIGDEPTGVAESISVPLGEFNVCGFQWSKDWKRVVLMDKNRFCLGFAVEEDMLG